MSIYNKIVLNGKTLIDLSNDTVDSSGDIGEGLVGHLNNGNTATGSGQLIPNPTPPTPTPWTRPASWPDLS